MGPQKYLAKELRGRVQPLSGGVKVNGNLVVGQQDFIRTHYRKFSMLGFPEA
jgi:hypothetical protein